MMKPYCVCEKLRFTSVFRSSFVYDATMVYELTYYSSPSSLGKMTRWSQSAQ